MLLPDLRLLLGYHNYYIIHGSPYTSVHVLIENTLLQHKMAKNSRIMGFIVVPVSLLGNFLTIDGCFNPLMANDAFKHQTVPLT